MPNSLVDLSDSPPPSTVCSSSSARVRPVSEFVLHLPDGLFPGFNNFSSRQLCLARCLQLNALSIRMEVPQLAGFKLFGLCAPAFALSPPVMTAF